MSFRKRFLGWISVLALMPGFGTGCAALSPFERETCVLGVTQVTETLHYAFGEDPVGLLLSRSSYPAEDGHLDALVSLGGTDEGPVPGLLRVVVSDASGQRLGSGTIRPIPGPQVFFAAQLPRSLAGGSGELQVVWEVAGVRRGAAARSFAVQAPASVATSGRVRLEVPNTGGVTLRGVPVTVGVPFPRGAFREGTAIRLVDATGQALPLQTRVLARWSRFGSIRWLLCDFACDLNGGPAAFWLEFGGEAAGAPEAELDESDWPWPGPVAGAALASCLVPESASGGFVTAEDGKRYEMVPEHMTVEIEEDGPCKRVQLNSGWYVGPDGEPFCRFVTRQVVFRGSPLLRINHTWIFTGDGNRERIRDMGWRFGLAGDAEPLGFLAGTGAEAAWLPGRYMLQHDYDKFDVVSGSGAVHEGQRAPGAFAARLGNRTLLIGVKDFWQNYPRELEFDGRSMVFHEWPRHGKPRRHEIDNGNKMRLWFCHEGELLDFRLPDVYTQPPIFSGLRHEKYWRENTPEDINAQGVAKTSELWVVVLPGTATAQDAGRLVQGLNDATLRAVVDPAWMAASGAFGEIHQRDVQNYPADERIYEEHALAPRRWAEAAQIYGKWVWGNMFWTPNLFGGGGGIYRGFRKAHQGWPYTWMPFVRNGDPRFFGFADAATRTMTDVCYCHYSDEKTGNRMRGQWYRGGMPWVGSNRGRPGRPFVPVLRGYSNEVEYLWRCYYLTGYGRARDVIEDWTRLVKDEVLSTGHLVLQPGTSTGRKNTNMLKTYTDMYEETFDPWFLAAAHQVARGPDRSHLRHFWKPGPRDFQRLSRDPDFTQWYVEDYARSHAAQQDVFTTGGWAGVCPQIESAAHAYLLTGEEFFLRRVVGWLDYTRAATYEGEPAFMRGFLVRDYNPGCGPSYTAYYLRQFPAALYALERAGRRPAALGSGFFQLPGSFAKVEDTDLYDWRMPTVAVLKRDGAALPLTVRLNRGRDLKEPFEYVLSGPGKRKIARGAVETSAPVEVIIPAEAPAGTYRLQLHARLRITPGSSSKIRFQRELPGLWLPISPPGTPEVMEFGAGESVGRACWKSHYWFRATPDLDKIEIEFPLPRDAAAESWAMLNRISIFDPDGALAWREEYCGRVSDGPASATAVLDVRPEHRGKLWSVAIPGRSFGFKPDPRLPRVFAVDADRWFEPDPPQS